MQWETQFKAMRTGTKHFAGGWVVVLVVIAFGIVVLQLTQGSVSPGADSRSAAQPKAVSTTRQVSVRDQPDRLIARCGRPDGDRDTGGFEPAPLVPARMLTYGKAHLRIAYVAADPKGQDPPYHWTLMELIDTRANRTIELSALQSTLQERLHCMLK